ncbi:MAG: EthD family reductase [Acidimicrobiia bacterium]
MTAAYLVIYEGEPDDPADFVRYYETVHVPLLWGFPAIRGVEMHVRHEGAGPFLVTRLLFDTVDELRHAVEGPYRPVTRRDMEENILPRFSGTVRHVVADVRPATGPPAS